MSRPRYLALPTGARAGRTSTRRGELAALVADPAQPDPGRRPVLLVPGFTGSKEDFLTVLAPLAADGRRVVAIDQLGQYESIGPADPAAYELPELGRDLLDVCAGLGGSVHLVGHSFGGFVARTAASLDDGKAIGSLTLIGSGPGRVTGAQTLGDLALLTAALPHQDLEAIWRAKLVLERELGQPKLEPAIEAFLHARFVQTSPVALAVAGGQLLADEDRLVDLRRRGAPLLVVTGSGEDVWSADELVAMAGALDAESAVVKGAGHSPAVDDPAATAAVLLDFFHDVEAPAR